jgi:hypothetical protein
VLYNKELKKQATQRRKPALSDDAQLFKEFETSAGVSLS